LIFAPDYYFCKKFTMAISRLQEDLIKDFQDQKRTINEQIKLIDPMATSLRMPVAHRLLNSTVSVVLEILCWLLVVASIGFVFFMDKMVPFYALSKLIQVGKSLDGFTEKELDMVQWSVRGLVILIALLFLIIARMLAKIRLKNSILHLAGKNMKQLVEENLKRRTAIDAIEQRHMLELPSTTDSIVAPMHKHNDTLL
jgi:hypothetical protein